MNTDHDYTIGKDHETCEDYAISGIVNNTAYAIVCDGCSASPDVDFGAMVLAKAAEETLFFQDSADYDVFGALTISKANNIFDIFKTLHLQALDATLIVSFIKDKQLTCYMYGDGVFVHKSKTNTRLVHIDYLSGAPAYLSYNLNKTRRANYDLEANMSKHVIDTIDGSFEPKSVKPFAPVVINTPVNDGDIISVCSDGINSFRKANNDSIPWTDLIEEYTGYKNFTGEFVKRRMNAFKRKCQKECITFYDDISIATIVI